MQYASFPRFFEENVYGYGPFEAFLREHVHDEKVLDGALFHLVELFLMQESSKVGIRATLQYLLDHGELPEEEICVPPPDQFDSWRKPDLAGDP